MAGKRRKRIRRKHPPLPRSIIGPPRWPRDALRLGAFAALALAIVCARSNAPQPQTDDWTRYHDRTFRVSRVVDGDTLIIEAPDGDRSVTRVRLWGVDAPETGQQSATYYGAEATEFAKRVLETRSVHVVLSPDSTRDRYDRLLAYVYLERGGRMFNEMLLEEGFAYADPRFPHHYKHRFQAMERRARREGAGLWAEVTLDQMPPWRQRIEQRATAETP